MILNVNFTSDGKKMQNFIDADLPTSRKEVGFQVRHDKRIGDSCSIKFITDGILLRELQNDFLLKRYSSIILDEAQERSLNTDILTGMLSRVIVELQVIVL
ncbi:putative RNA helicase [Helianthus debilis subsp. tardiflorus]